MQHLVQHSVPELVGDEPTLARIAEALADIAIDGEASRPTDRYVSQSSDTAQGWLPAGDPAFVVLRCIDTDTPA